MDTGFPLCDMCDETVLPGEPVADTFIGRAIHWECGLRAIMGGANHIRQLCPCFGGTLEADPPGLSRRDAAREAVKAFQEKRQS